jgi:hypothetical protein
LAFVKWDGFVRRRSEGFGEVEDVQREGGEDGEGLDGYFPAIVVRHHTM